MSDSESRITGRVFRPHPGGFTLLEVMLAVALLALLAGGLFAIVSGTMASAAELHQRQNRQQQVEGLVALCQRTFRTLPSSASLQGGVREESGVYLPEVILRQAPAAFSWGDPSVALPTAVLRARPQVGGLFGLGLLREHDSSGVESSSESERPVRWLMLLSDIRKLEWRFYDSRTATWMEEWNDHALRPSLVELTLTLAGELSPVRFIFWLPPLARTAP
ncbi:MAG: prepilin-type N-terminal cleavage/methylation domain-containing protein [Verrucomicrobia bacterium]|nr:prepilin-type N-terminal cleavage/methylation domain-containing protein [Verrucomicrobiota bacterium]